MLLLRVSIHKEYELLFQSVPLLIACFFASVNMHAGPACLYILRHGNIQCLIGPHHMEIFYMLIGMHILMNDFSVASYDIYTL